MSRLQILELRHTSPRRDGGAFEPTDVVFDTLEADPAERPRPRSATPARCRRPLRPRTAPTSATCSGREMPKPSAIGSSVCARIRRTNASAPCRHRASRPGDAEPRDAVQETRARAPPPRRIRASVVVGLRRKIVSRPDGSERLAEVARFFDRQVECEDAVDAGRRRSASESDRCPSARSGWHS